MSDKKKIGGAPALDGKGEGGVILPPAHLPLLNTGLARDTYGDPATTFGTSYTDSVGTTTFGSNRTPATSLYGSTIWSPIPSVEATQSANMLDKLSWEQYTNQPATGSVQGTIGVATSHHHHQQVPREQVLGTQMPQTGMPNPARGLGLVFGSMAPIGEINLNDEKGNVVNTTTAGSAEKTTTTPSSVANTSRYQYTQCDIPHPRADPFMQEQAAPNASTYPLMQQAFCAARDMAEQPRTSYANVVSETSSTDTLPNVAQGPADHTSRATKEDATGYEDDAKSFTTNPFQDDKLKWPLVATTTDDRPPGEATSVLSAHYTVTYPHLVGQEKQLFKEEPHPVNFKRQVLDGNVEIEQAFEGARNCIMVMNPSHFAMDFGVS